MYAVRMINVLDKPKKRHAIVTRVRELLSTPNIILRNEHIDPFCKRLARLKGTLYQLFQRTICL